MLGSVSLESPDREVGWLAMKEASKPDPQTMEDIRESLNFILKKKKKSNGKESKVFR